MNRVIEKEYNRDYKRSDNIWVVQDKLRKVENLGNRSRKTRNVENAKGEQN